MTGAIMDEASGVSRRKKLIMPRLHHIRNVDQLHGLEGSLGSQSTEVSKRDTQLLPTSTVAVERMTARNAAKS